MSQVAAAPEIVEVDWSFAPGPVPDWYDNLHSEVSYLGSHRYPAFRAMYAKTQEHLRGMLGRPEVLLVQGSASAAIEAVLCTIAEHWPIHIVTSGEFSRRAYETLKLHRGTENLSYQRPDLFLAQPKSVLYGVQFETAASQLHELEPYLEVCRAAGGLSIVDAVSGFPFYAAPSANVVITSSSKQLRGAPALGIVGLDKHYWDWAGGQRSEYLDLFRIAARARTGESPHTSLIPQVSSLYHSLVCNKWQPGVHAIPENAAIVRKVVGDASLVGWRSAPVLTIRTIDRARLLKLAAQEKMEIYCNAAYAGDSVQVSCYNYADPAPYHRLATVLQRAKEMGCL